MNEVSSKSQTGFLLDIDVKKKLMELSSLLDISMTAIVSDLIRHEYSRQKHTPFLPRKIRGNRIMDITVSNQDYEAITAFIEFAYGVDFPCEQDVRKHLEECIENNAMYAAKEADQMRKLDNAMKTKDKSAS